MRRTPRIYEKETNEPDLTKQPKKSALKKTKGPESSVQSNNTNCSDTVNNTNFNTPGGRTSPPPQSTNSYMPSPKATPVNQGPPRPKPRITLLRYVEIILVRLYFVLKLLKVTWIKH